MPFQEIHAPLIWRCVDFISDLHLQESEPKSVEAWRNYLEQSPAEAIFILGDLFEVWVGDDVLCASNNDSFEMQCSLALAACAKNRSLYFLHGNRDFLLGSDMGLASGMQILSDPCVFNFGNQRYLLSHGDELCTGDAPYQKFRAMVRSQPWQTTFLATPLHERLHQARTIRNASEARKNDMAQSGEPWVDIDPSAAMQWMNEAKAQHFIHGHTHEGRDHPIASQQGEGVRHVLPDWDASASPARGWALRLSLSPSGEVGTQRVAVF
jgi:UDP-2,3-diacylglucosamine hydrolase